MFVPAALIFPITTRHFGSLWNRSMLALRTVGFTSPRIITDSIPCFFKVSATICPATVCQHMTTALSRPPCKRVTSSSANGGALASPINRRSRAIYSISCDNCSSVPSLAACLMASSRSGCSEISLRTLESCPCIRISSMKIGGASFHHSLFGRAMLTLSSISFR